MLKKITLFFASLFFMMLTVQSQTVNLTKNPYANVNWSTYNQYKANFHTHTTNSDGSQSPSEVINEYYSKGYSILAITDHNFTTWPWPDNPGMLAVRGDEYSSSHHMNALFNFTSSSNNIEDGIPHVQSNGGMVQINHPGRYNSPSNWSWYVPWYRDYSSCVTLEVFNQGDRYSSDRQLWDNINENYFIQEGKFVWGTSNDDKHSTSQLYGNFSFMLMPDLTEASFRESITNGAFYFCYEPGRSGDANVPRINEIVVDELAKTITISATGYNTVQWIGPGTTVIASGEVFDYSAYINQPFIRAVLSGSNGSSYTQPFGFGDVTGTTPTNNRTSDQMESSIGIYPNPSVKGMITISGIQSVENAKVHIYDINGKLHIINNPNSNTTEINVAELSTGIYVVKIADGKQLITKKLIIK